MNKITGSPVLDEIVCHDDSLVFTGQKDAVGLDAEWYKVMPKSGEITGIRVMYDARFTGQGETLELLKRTV